MNIYMYAMLNHFFVSPTLFFLDHSVSIPNTLVWRCLKYPYYMFLIVSSFFWKSMQNITGRQVGIVAQNSNSWKPNPVLLVGNNMIHDVKHLTIRTTTFDHQIVHRTPSKFNMEAELHQVAGLKIFRAISAGEGCVVLCCEGMRKID